MPPVQREMARRLMVAYIAMGCRQTWTCAPYQVGHRPAQGEDIAWAESNAVVFANSVLGARTNRYGDFLDICAALTGRAPHYGLHLPAKSARHRSGAHRLSFGELEAQAASSFRCWARGWGGPSEARSP